MVQKFEKHAYNAVSNSAVDNQNEKRQIEAIAGEHDVGDEHWASIAGPSRGGFTLAEAYALIRKRYEF